MALAAILGQKLVAETAASQEIQRSQGDSTLMIVAQQLQDMIDNCLVFHANYLNIAEIGNAFVSLVLLEKIVQYLLRLNVKIMKTMTTV